MLKKIRLISDTESTTIDPTDGTQTLMQVTGVFIKQTHGCLSCNTPWNLDQPSRPTQATPVLVYEMIPYDYQAIDATNGELFKSPNLPTRDTYFDSLCLTQSQIISFVKKYPHLLFRPRINETQKTFFRFNLSPDQRLVARIGMTKKGLEVYVIPLETELFHYQGDSARIVVPKLTHDFIHPADAG